jgi:hypothetical protein
MTEVSPSQNELLAWMSELSNFGRWRSDDQRGTLNLITPAKTAAAPLWFARE